MTEFGSALYVRRGVPIKIPMGSLIVLADPLRPIGDLYVYPGEVGVRLRRLLPGKASYTDEVLRQQGGVVQVNESRLMPWFNTALVIRSPTDRVVVGVGGRPRPALYSALHAAGLLIDRRRRSLVDLYAIGDDQT